MTSESPSELPSKLPSKSPSKSKSPSESLEDKAEAYIKGSEEDLNAFDKNFFWVAAGIFAFTVTFIKDIVPVRDAHMIIFLLISWVCFALSVAITILSFTLSAFGKQDLARLIHEYKNQKEGKPPTKKASLEDLDATIRKKLLNDGLDHWWVKMGCRILTVGFFLAGLLFLLLFLIINFYAGNARKNETATTGPKTEYIAIPSGTNPITPIYSGGHYDSTIRHIDSVRQISQTYSLHVDSTYVIIKPDTIYVRDGACSCPPGKHICSPACKKKH